ncbi:MAG: diadenylate cyclase CdaA [Acidobacteriota bacterium]
MNALARFHALQFGWRDVLDILIVGFVMYNVLLLIRGTRAMQMTVGLLAIGVAYFVARTFDLLALEAVSREVLFYLPFAIIVLFQHEIRRALASFGRNPLVSFLSHAPSTTHLDEIVKACMELAARRIGALIAIERTQSLRTYAESGKALDALISSELLQNIFIPNTPLHDGAAIVQSDRIVAAGTFLPLSSNIDISRDFGTRHRAAIGLSEETDAFVIVISEENGALGVAVEGILHENLKGSALADFIAIYVTAGKRAQS